MSETIERESEHMSYRTMTQNDAIDLRVERIRDLEREHYRLALVAEENGGRLTPDQDRQRLDIERRITHQVDVVWPGESTPSTEAPDYPDGPPPFDEVAHAAGRGTPVDPPTFDDLGELGAPLRDTSNVHAAAHADDPVEDDPELSEGQALGDVEGGASHGADRDAHESADVFGRGLSTLQRISHFPSERDRQN